MPSSIKTIGSTFIFTVKRSRDVLERQFVKHVCWYILHRSTKIHVDEWSSSMFSISSISSVRYLRFSKEVATFLSYFYLFISFCKILSSLVNSSLHNFTSPFSPSFPPLLNYDSKHRLPLFSLLFIVFFSSILINGSPLFVASLNEFRSDWILSFPFSFPFPNAQPFLPNLESRISPAPASSFLSISRPGVIDTSDSSAMDADQPVTKTNEGKHLYCLFERELPWKPRIDSLARQFYSGIFITDIFSLLFLFVRFISPLLFSRTGGGISNFLPPLFEFDITGCTNRYRFSCKFPDP